MTGLLVRCHQCRELEDAYDQKMDVYVRLTDEQTRHFRQGNAGAGRDLDSGLWKARIERDSALSRLVGHQAIHFENETPVYAHVRSHTAGR